MFWSARTCLGWVRPIILRWRNISIEHHLTHCTTINFIDKSLLPLFSFNAQLDKESRKIEIRVTNFAISGAGYNTREWICTLVMLQSARERGCQISTFDETRVWHFAKRRRLSWKVLYFWQLINSKIIPKKVYVNKVGAHAAALRKWK